MSDGQPPVDDAQEPDREALLAEKLSREYDFLPLSELEQEDPARAQEHRDAARNLAKWIEECPREERRAAFGRGFDKGKERQKVRTAADMRRMKAEVDDLRQHRDPEGLRSRIRELEYVIRGYSRIVTGGSDLRSDLADALKRLAEAQRELAVLKGVQPSNATSNLPS